MPSHERVYRHIEFRKHQVKETIPALKGWYRTPDQLKLADYRYILSLYRKYTNRMKDTFAPRFKYSK